MADKKQVEKIEEKIETNNAPEKGSYTAKDIYVLEGLDPVRKRPAMYIGSTGPDGLHHLIWECVDNSLDEAMAGYAKNVEVALLPDNRVMTVDDGRGIPVEKHPQTKKSALETVMTTLHAGGKFGGDAYKVSGGLHGVGVSVVCALSTFMRTEVCRDGGKYRQEYAKGKVMTKVDKIGTCKQTGTSVTFEPDIEIFKDIKFDAKRILSHLRQQAYLSKGVKITFRDEREKPGASHSFYFEGGLASYIKYLTGDIAVRHQNIFYCSGERTDIAVEAALQYTDEYECYEESFANNINTGEGGTHLTGFRAAITRTFNDYAKKNEILKEKEENLSGEDVREGLTGVVSVKIREPQFEGQTKAKLGNTEAKLAVEQVVSEALADFLERNPQDAKSIIEKCLLSSRARKAAKAARETVLRKGILEGLALPGKLADCSSRKPEESELFIVEGESAGGCFSGDTKVALTDGRNLTFKELVEEDGKGKKNYCYTTKEYGSMGIELIKNPRITRRNVEVIKLILDNEEELVCTPDHLFMMRDGSYKEAQLLGVKDSLMPLRRQFSRMGKRITIEGYELVYDNKDHRWIFTHLLADDYNLENKFYSKENGSHRHHIDFNKLNNNPDNVTRMLADEHLEYYCKMLEYSLHSESTKEKIRQIHKLKYFREKIIGIMTAPKMRAMLSERAKKQWESEEYKNYMANKFLDFYNNNQKYREKNSKILYKNQKKYWANEENRKNWGEKLIIYFKSNPEKREALFEKAKIQWQDSELLKWRSGATKEQWTSEFRIKRKETYNRTYLEKALGLLRKIYEEGGKINVENYEGQKAELKDKSILRFNTICQRFFGGNKQRLEEAVVNLNHKIKKIIKLQERIDVYDLEVEGTHNFALSSGIFVHNSGKQGRNRKFQAILPLRGKILNVERSRLDKILESKEVRALVIALGTAIGEDFNLEKVRYHKIIIMADADVDGNHIRTLLLTLFYRYFKPLIEKGYIYIAQPPLYKIQFGKRMEYAFTEEQKQKVLDSFIKDKIINPSIQRYKGLGEMNPDQLWETTMDPEKRVVLQVIIDDAKEADRMFDTLMGEEVLPRKKFIQTYAKEVRNLDI